MIERELLISVLKLTMNGQFTFKDVVKLARVPSLVALNILKNLQAEHLLNVKDGVIGADADSRIKLAVKAVTLGADIERVSGLLCWQEFEEIAAVALEANGYVVAKNVRFKHGGRRWEIDVVGCRKPRVICIDCKHWHHGLHPASLRRIVGAQTERTKAFSEVLPTDSFKLECTRWNKAEFFPVILSLIQCSTKFVDDVPVVAVLQLQDFLTQMPVYANSLKCFTRVFSRLGNDF